MTIPQARKLSDDKLQIKLNNFSRIDYYKHEDPCLGIPNNPKQCLDYIYRSSQFVNYSYVNKNNCLKSKNDKEYKTLFNTKYQSIWLVFDSISKYIGKVCKVNFNMDIIIFNILSYIQGDLFVSINNYKLNYKVNIYVNSYKLNIIPIQKYNKNLSWYVNKNISCGGDFVEKDVLSAFKIFANKYSILRTSTFSYFKNINKNILEKNKTFIILLYSLYDSYKKIIDSETYNKQLKDNELNRQRIILDKLQDKYDSLFLEKDILELKLNIYYNLESREFLLQRILSIREYELIAFNIYKQYHSCIMEQNKFIFRKTNNSSYLYERIRALTIKCTIIAIYLLKKSKINIFSDFDFTFYKYGDIVHYSLLTDDELILNIFSVIDEYFVDYHLVESIGSKLLTIYSSIESYVIKKFIFPSFIKNDKKYHKGHIFYNKKIIQYEKLLEDKQKYISKYEFEYNKENSNFDEIENKIKQQVMQNKLNKNRAKRQRKKLCKN